MGSGKNRGNGGVGCLVMIVLVWLLFFGGCEKMERLIDTKIAANEKKVEQPTQTQPAQERVKAEDVASISPNVK